MLNSVFSVTTATDLRNLNASDQDAICVMVLDSVFPTVWKWHRTSTTADDGATVMQVAGVTTGRWVTVKHSLISPIINVTSDAVGDTYFRDGTGAFSRLGIGSTGQVLTVSGGLPTWAASGGGGGSGITTLNTLTGLTQTFATGTTGTDFNIVSATTTHTFHLPIASAVNTGKLSATDWSTFNSKLSANQSITLSGDISGTGTTSITTTIGALKVTNGMLAGAIAYSKLSLTGSIVNADLAGSIAYSKLTLTGAILNADLAGSIAYSKLTLTGAILNADLAGSIAASKLVGTDIATVGTITAGTWNGALISGNSGGTGVANTGKTITLGGNLTTSGAFATTLISTALTSITLPTAGTLATLAGTETLTAKTLTSPVINVTSDATGDIYYRSAGGLFTRLGIGATNTVLTVIAGLPSWVAGGAGASLSTIQTWTAAQTFSALTTLSGGLSGVISGVNAGAGVVGEEITASQSTYTNYTTTATYQNVASIALTAGDWEITALGTFSVNSATLTTGANATFVISTTTASAAGATEGVNIFYISQSFMSPTSKSSVDSIVYRVNISAGATYYLNTQATFTSGNPQFVGTIRARRIR